MNFLHLKGLPALIFLLFSSLNIIAQDLEVTGKLKVKQTQKVNTADSVVVRLNDGTFAIRDATTFVGGTGNGIANVVDNENGTFTFNFTNGGSFTTSVLTGPQGPPGADGLASVQTLSLSTSNLTLSDGGGTVSINDADASPSNEIQTISRVGTTVTLSNGGGTFQDSVLTEAQVDAFVNNNNFLTAEVDGSNTNEIQTISRTGTIVTLSSGGGTFQDSVLTEAQVDAFANNNNYLTSEVDGSITNEIQTISRTGTTVILSNGGGSFEDSILTETEVDLMVGNNGYLTQELDAGWLKNQDSTTTTNFVGIGITNPDAKLHVVGNIKIVDGNQGNGKILTSDSEGLATWIAEVPATAVPIPLKYQGSLIYVYPSDNATAVDWSSAKTACTAVNAFGHADWYLPNLSELNAMYKQSYLITGLDETSSTKYWSDTEKDVTDAYALRLDYGGPDPDLKTISANHNARCIRKN